MAEARSVQVAQQETHEALGNAIKLGASLVVTLAMSFGVRLLLPRYLGPELFGPLNFADAFAAAFFVVLGLGLDVYVRREVSIRPEHAMDFLGGILLVRLGLVSLLFLAMGLLLHAGHRAPLERQLVYLYGLAQLFITTNISLSALLHARGRVDGLSVSNVGTKALWGLFILASLALRLPLWGIPLAMVLSEAVETVILTSLVRRHLGWSLKVDFKATWTVIAVSLPFFLNTVAHTVYSKLGVSMLAFISTDDAEVGRYGAASNLAGLTLLITPLIGWVLMPLYSKAQHRSDEEFNQTLRRSLEFILALGFPVSLMLGVGAEFWMRVAFGPAYASGALALRILAPLFLITYVAMVSATCLINLRRAWTMTFISLVGLILNPILNWAFIHLALQWRGSSTGGAACALADVGTEVAVTAVMLYLVGRRAFDRRSVAMIGKTLAVCAAVLYVDHLLWAWGPVRLIVDALVYVLGVLGTGAVRLGETIDVVQTALQRRHAKNAA
jgi:O-antigen/teichoic acid export membrane protein